MRRLFPDICFYLEVWSFRVWVFFLNVWQTKPAAGIPRSCGPARRAFQSPQATGTCTARFWGVVQAPRATAAGAARFPRELASHREAQVPARQAFRDFPIHRKPQGPAWHAFGSCPGTAIPRGRRHDSGSYPGTASHRDRHCTIPGVVQAGRATRHRRCAEVDVPGELPYGSNTADAVIVVEMRASGAL